MIRHALRRLKLAAVAALLFASFVTVGCGRHGAHTIPAASRSIVYVGTYTDGGSRGIYRFTFDAAAGTATEPVLAGESSDPSFLALHPNGRTLYAVNELGNFDGATTGAVSAFAIDPASGMLRLINQVASGGADPCYITVDKSGKNALVANYTSGTVAVFPLDAEGRLRTASVVRRHSGSGPDMERQATAHAHEIILDPAERYALAADLGADRIFVYRFDAAAGTLQPDDPESVALEAGSGPRHLAWHPSRRILYAINELRSTVTALRYDAARGVLEPFQTITTLPAGFSGKNTAGELVISTNGRFLYTSNRGDDTLAVFTIDPGTATLTPIARVSTGGRTPRNFAIDPSGRWLLVANQDSDSIAFFRLDPTSGIPAPSGHHLAISRPVCLLFAPAGVALLRERGLR